MFIDDVDRGWRNIKHGLKIKKKKKRLELMLEKKPKNVWNNVGYDSRWFSTWLFNYNNDLYQWRAQREFGVWADIPYTFSPSKWPLFWWLQYIRNKLITLHNARNISIISIWVRPGLWKNILANPRYTKRNIYCIQYNIVIKNAFPSLFIYW